jgi:hypothetical protein
MLVSQLAVFEFVPAVEASPWWNSSWTYRKSHQLYNATGAGTNYQVKITVINGTGTDSGNTVYINNKTRSDFGDVRFVNTTDNGEYDYWMETLNTGVNATFWVEIGEDLSSTNQTIYTYYGNPTATTTSSFSNTMIVLTANPTFTPYGSRYPSDNNIQENPANTLVPDGTYGDMKTYDAWTLQDEGCNWVWDFGSTAGRAFRVKWKASATAISGYSTDFTITISISPDASTWTTVTSYQFTATGTKDDTTSEGAGSHRYVKVDQHSTTSCMVSPGYTYADAVYARKYVSPAPSHGSWGSEETSGVTYQRSAGQTLTLQAVSSRQMSNQRNAVQSLQFLLQSSRQSSPIRLVNQALISVASATRQLTVVRTPEQQLPFLTETSRQTSYIRIFDQAVSFLQAVARQFTVFRTADQNFLILTETARSTSYQRTSSTALSIMADALRTLSTPRTASLQLTVLTEASKTATYSRTASQMLSALTQTARQLTLPRSPTQTLSILTATSRSPTLQRTANQILTVLLSTTRQATYTRPVNQPLNFLTTSTIAKIFWRYASQVLTILTQTTRQLTLNRFAQQPLNILLSATRQASYRRTAEVLLQINTRTAIKFIIYVEVPTPTPTPTPTPVPLMPSIRLDAIIQTARITSLWWQRTTALEVLVINKGTVASDVTFEYTLLDQNNQIITQGTQAVFISGLDKKTVYVNIPTPPDGKYTIQFRTTQPVKVEVKSVVVVETPFYGKLTFSILIIFLLILTIYIIRRRRLSYS